MNKIYKAGISCYLGLDDYSLNDNLKYLKKVKNLGYECVFSSYHINEASNNNDELAILIKECNTLGLKLSLDVSKKAYLEIKDYDIASLRLDYGFSDEEIINLSKERKIELNASTINIDKLNSLLNNGLNQNNVILSFNFYPKKYTGHDLNDVKNKTLLFHNLGFEVACFIPSKKNFRPPLYEGLPSIEEHRYQPLDLIIEELKCLKMDYIYFGDAVIDDEELNTLLIHKCEEILIKVIKLQEKAYFEPYIGKLLSIRPDYNSLMLRLSGTRTNDKIDSFNTITRHYGDLTIDNHLFKRYMGEINIITSELSNDERVNVIGQVLISDLIIEYLKQELKLKFIL